MELVQWAVKDPHDQHVWVQGIRKAFDIDIQLGVVTNDDRTKVFFNYDVRCGRRFGLELATEQVLHTHPHAGACLPAPGRAC